MKPEDLKEEIDIELELMEGTVQELVAIYQDVSERDLTIREEVAAATFLAQFYNGVENILKRICRFHNVPIPTGKTWHMNLFKQFCSPPHRRFPNLFDDSLAASLAPFRRFRHVVFHGYSIQIEWSRMSQGVASVEEVFTEFKGRLFDYLQSLDSHLDET